MEAPKKIYLFENPVSGDVDDWWLRMRSGEDDIEYTRTDAFIEKAQKYFRHTPHLFKLDGFELHEFIEDFRKYMEGE